MSGAYVIHALLRANAPLIAVVPATRIHYGYIPVAGDGSVTVPALLVSEVSGQQRNTVAMNNATYLQTDRVQITCYSKTYLQMHSLMDLARRACPHTRGTVATFTVDSVLFESRGPDLSDAAAGLFIQSLDVFVRWQAAA